MARARARTIEEILALMAKSTKSAKPRESSSSRAKPAIVKAPRQPGVERRKNHPLRAKHGYMQVILTFPVPSLGQTGDLVKVRPGYARNYLLPQGLANFATPHNLRIIEQHRERLRKIEEAKRADLINLAAQMAGREIRIDANATEEGHLYGSVTADQIAAALRAYSYPVEESHVKIEGPLKETGIYTIKIQLQPEIGCDIKLWVVPMLTEGRPEDAPAQ
jgi:large subunit ribosomal protein L9